MQKKLLIVLLLLSNFCVLFSQEKLPFFGQNTNKEIIKAMTLDEKVRFLIGLGMKLKGVPLPANTPAVGQVETGVVGSASSSYAIPRLKVPSYVLADGPAGLRIASTRDNDTKTYYCTAFPVESLLACTWDTELVQRVGAAIGNEVKEYGVDIWLGPGMNIHRNPLGGRNFEYFSEDPYLTGKMATAVVKGVQFNEVGVSAKHFVANEHEFNRNKINIKVSERALREIYLRPFEMVVKDANPWTIMSSYNKINGTTASQNHDLLTKILRDDWKFEGFVMTDWFGGVDAVAQMKAGNDLLMPGTPLQVEALLKAVKDKTLDEAVLDTNIERVMNILLKMPAATGFKASNKPDLKAHAILARQAAAEGMVLLKNDKNTLPLAAAQKLVAFGNFSYDLISGGTGSGDVNEAYTISLPEGLKNAGFSINENLKKEYENYLTAEKAKQAPTPFFMPKTPLAEMDLTDSQIELYSTQSDVAVLTIGRHSGEFLDRKKETDYEILEKERVMIEKVSEAFHAKGKKVVAILNIGGPIDIASWRDEVDAILLAWQSGQEAGNAIADVLSGKVNPSAKLATTFSKSYDEEPTAANFPGKEWGETAMNPIGIPDGKDSECIYEEDVFVGYRAYDKKSISPAYEFGYGLSYTNFLYRDLKVSPVAFKNKDKDKIQVTVTVINIGKVSGREVVQLYVAAPGLMMSKPVHELKAFAKTLLLKPLQSQTITFELSARDLASFDEKSSHWITETGTYTIKVGASSRDIRHKSQFLLERDVILERVSKAMMKEK